MCNNVETNMIKELKESSKVVEYVINFKSNIFFDFFKKFENKKVVITGMGSSFFVSEIGGYLLKKCSSLNNIYVCSSDEIDNNIFNLNSEYVIVTLSQSGNTKEVSFVLDKYKNTDNFSLTSNEKGHHINLSKYNYVYPIGLEKSPVSTKYVVFSILLFYKLSLFLSHKNDDLGINKLYDFSLNVFKEYDNVIVNLTDKYSDGDNFLIVGSGVNYYIAKEISLKIRETTGVVASYDNIGQLNHGGINSINNKTVCILLDYDEQIILGIKKRGGKVISIGTGELFDINFDFVNDFISIVQKIILLQFFVHKLSNKLSINTDLKNW